MNQEKFNVHNRDGISNIVLCLAGTWRQLRYALFLELHHELRDEFRGSECETTLGQVHISLFSCPIINFS